MKKLFEVLGALAYFTVQGIYLLEALDRVKRRKKNDDQEDNFEQLTIEKVVALQSIAASLRAQLTNEQRKTRSDIIREEYKHMTSEKDPDQPSD